MATAATAIVQSTLLSFNRAPRGRVSSSFKISTSPAIDSLSSELFGLRIDPIPRSTHLSNPRPRSIHPIVARRVCQFTGKKANRANHVSFSNHKTKRQQFVNLQYKKIWWEAGKRFIKLRLSTKALKTIEKNGLDAVAKKAGIDLSKK